MDIVPLLQKLGLSEYEAKAYKVLLDSGIVTAKHVSNLSGIPLTRIYESLVSLEKRGLVATMETRPKRYRALGPDSLRNLIEEKRRRVEEEVKEAENIYETIRSVVSEPPSSEVEVERESFWIFRGRDNCMRELKRNLKEAREEIKLFVGDLSWIDEVMDILEEKSKEGVKFKILCHVNKNTEERVRKLLNLGFEIRSWDEEIIKGNIKDGEKANLTFKNPRPGVRRKDTYGEPGSDRLFNYELLMSMNPVFVKMVETYFESFWKNGRNARELLD